MFCCGGFGFCVTVLNNTEAFVFRGAEFGYTLLYPDVW